MNYAYICMIIIIIIIHCKAMRKDYAKIHNNKGTKVYAIHEKRKGIMPINFQK